jgi:hypothetical protein
MHSPRGSQWRQPAKLNCSMGATRRPGDSLFRLPLPGMVPLSANAYVTQQRKTSRGEYCPRRLETIDHFEGCSRFKSLMGSGLDGTL